MRTRAFNPETGSIAGKLSGITRKQTSTLLKQLDKLAESNQRGSELVGRFLEEQRPGTDDPRYMKMLLAADKRACAGDMKAIAWFWDRYCGKAAMAAADREAGRPILQMNNNQIIAQQAPQAQTSLDASLPATRVITLPSILPGSPATSPSTSEASSEPSEMPAQL